MTQKAKEKAEAIAWLRERVKPGDTVYTVLRHVSRSGMSRNIDLYKIDPDGPIWLSGMASRAGLGRLGERDHGIVVRGCGMDMGFHLVYNLARTLYADSHICTGDDCPSNDHSNGDRDYTPHAHKDGGYALRHRWL